MNLYFHGGRCCGIKTIAGFMPQRSSKYGEKDEFKYLSLTAKGEKNNSDAHGHDVETKKPFFTDAAPEETTEPRLDRLIKFCKERRPKGAIEVALAEGGSYYEQNTDFGPLLLERGFIQTVPPFLNSNSGNVIYIYHLVYNEEAVVKPSDPVPSPFELDDDCEDDDEYEEEYEPDYDEEDD